MTNLRAPGARGIKLVVCPLPSLLSKLPHCPSGAMGEQRYKPLCDEN